MTHPQPPAADEPASGLTEALTDLVNLAYTDGREERHPWSLQWQKLEKRILAMAALRAQAADRPTAVPPQTPEPVALMKAVDAYADAAWFATQTPLTSKLWQERQDDKDAKRAAVIALATPEQAAPPQGPSRVEPHTVALATLDAYARGRRDERNDAEPQPPGEGT